MAAAVIHFSVFDRLLFIWDAVVDIDHLHPQAKIDWDEPVADKPYRVYRNTVDGTRGPEIDFFSSELFHLNTDFDNCWVHVQPMQIYMQIKKYIQVHLCNFLLRPLLLKGTSTRRSYRGPLIQHMLAYSFTLAICLGRGGYTHTLPHHTRLPRWIVPIYNARWTELEILKKTLPFYQLPLPERKLATSTFIQPYINEGIWSILLFLQYSSNN